MSDISQSTDNSTDFDDPAALEAALFGDDTPQSDDVKPDDQAAKPAGEAEDDNKPEDKAEGDDKNPEAKAEAKDGEGDGDEPVYIVKIDGEEHEVTESELLAGYQRQRDYTQKTQGLADDRRTFEQERSAEIEQLRNALAYYALPTTKEPRPEDFAGQPDPNAAFVQAYGQWQQQSARQAEAAQLLEAITAEEQQRTLEREAGLLQQAIPEWADETVRQADYAKMMQSASDRYGFTQEEIAGVTDHRLLLLLRDASRAADLEAKPIEMKRKTEVKPKLSAGAKVKTDPSADRQKRALEKLNKGSLSDDDMADLLFQ